MAEGHLLCVSPENVADVWPMVASMIDKAFAELDEVTPDYLPWLLADKGLLWVYAVDNKVIAAAMTSLVQRRGGLACRIVAVGAGGAIGAALWRQHIPQIEDYAKSRGCYKVSIDGRRGWTKVLTDYDPKCVSFEKRI